MKRVRMATAAALALIADPVVAKDRQPHLYGPPPNWSQFEALALAALQAQLIDPQSAQLSWSGSYFKGAFKPFLEPRIEGYVGCGQVNARNRLGGYAGRVAFVVVEDYDRVLYASIADPKLDAISIQCNTAVEQGLIQPLPPVEHASLAVAEPAATTGAPTASGLTLRAMPEGAYISAVAPGSPAAAAGLKPGIVITSVNGIALAGMGEAMTKVLSAANDNASLTLVDGRTVKLGAVK